jgi:hypothetical protein
LQIDQLKVGECLLAIQSRWVRDLYERNGCGYAIKNIIVVGPRPMSPVSGDAVMFAIEFAAAIMGIWLIVAVIPMGACRPAQKSGQKICGFPHQLPYGKIPRTCIFRLAEVHPGQMGPGLRR